MRSRSEASIQYSSLFHNGEHLKPTRSTYFHSIAFLECDKLCLFSEGEVPSRIGLRQLNFRAEDHLVMCRKRTWDLTDTQGP